MIAATATPSTVGKVNLIPQKKTSQVQLEEEEKETQTSLWVGSL